MDMLPLGGWAALIALLLGVLTAASMLTIAALKSMVRRLETLQAVLNGRLSQLVALTAVASEAIGAEKGRLAEIARVISKTLPVDEPTLAGTLAHFERTNGDDKLVIPIPANPTPTVILVPTETDAPVSAMESAAERIADVNRTAAERIEGLHRQAKEEKP